MRCLRRKRPKRNVTRADVKNRSRQTDRSEATPKRARVTALRLLQRRDYSATQLQRRLQARGFAASDAREVLQDLAAAGWQSDTRFAESYVRSRANKGFGPLRIAGELRLCGVDEALTAPVLALWNPDWSRLARAALSKRFGVGPPSDREDSVRRRRFLQYRGFSQQHIREALAADDAGCDEEFEPFFDQEM
jgi:regulatory protein